MKTFFHLGQSIAVIAWIFALATLGHAQGSASEFRSSYLSAELNPDQPGLRSLALDPLGHSVFLPDTLESVTADGTYTRMERRGDTARYFRAGETKPAWQMHFHKNSIVLESRYSGRPLRDLTLTFDPDQVHATLLGRPAGPNQIALPAVLHLPGMGSFRVSGDEGAHLAYEAKRSGKAFVRVGFPAADPEHRHVKYRLQVARIAPKLMVSLSDTARDGFERNFLNIFQLNADLNILANNAASDPCAFTLYLYADLAVYTPPLAKGLTAMDLLRGALDHYLAGFKGYGMPGWQAFDAGPSHPQPYTFSDVYPSLLISAADYVRATHDDAWAAANYSRLRAWAEAMLATDTNGDGLMKYAASGNAGSWGSETIRPANWWDTIGFGYEDAYSNALAYRALLDMAQLADRLHWADDAARYRVRAQRIRATYAVTFLNPKTGLLAGWKSEDGALHDYAFTFVNGIAIRYGLVDEPTAQAILTRLLAKMNEVGYTRFDLGLPGNLIPIRREDSFTTEHRWGGSLDEEGRGGFEIYENGGATACFSYFLIGALEQEGRPEGQQILAPILESIARNGFSGKGADGMTNDWKDWQGGAHGYEGMLVDNYYVYLAVVEPRGRAQP